MAENQFVCIQVNDVVAAGQELDEEMMSKLSNMKVSNINQWLIQPSTIKPKSNPCKVIRV